MSPSDQADQEGELSISMPAGEPSYGACLGWMREIPEDRAVAFDFWARGNFVRHILHQRAMRSSPLLVPAGHPGQMRWAFRRLALAGLPVDFVYTGPLSEPKLVKHWHPLDIPIDCGWGYVVFAGTIVKSRTDREFWPVLGEASLMPDSVIEWIVNEVAGSFESGRVFVAPAQLIGIDRDRSILEVDALAEVTNAVTSAEVPDEAMAILDLEIPWIDGMTPSDFDKLLSDYGDELADFQAAFRHLVSGYHESPENLAAARERLADSVAELQHSARAA